MLTIVFQYMNITRYPGNFMKNFLFSMGNPKDDNTAFLYDAKFVSEAIPHIKKLNIGIYYHIDYFDLSDDRKIEKKEKMIVNLNQIEIVRI